MEPTTSTLNETSRELEARNWLELPLDVMGSILEKVGVIDVLENAQYVCTTWRRICKEPSIWKTIYMRATDDSWECSDRLVKICMRAVDLSDGHLLHLNLEYFGSDELLLYVTERSSQLRSLWLLRCYDVSSHGLCKAVENLRLLEELHLYYISVTKEAIEVVGRCCPSLKSFKLRDPLHRLLHVECDDYAVAIAETMPGLCDLQLLGDKMTNCGLLAILDGCPHLVSLDLRQCLFVDLAGDLGKRCSEQIKNLRSPFEYIERATYSESFYEEYPARISDVDLYTDDDDDDDDYEYGYSDFDDMYIDELI